MAQQLVRTSSAARHVDVSPEDVSWLQQSSFMFSTDSDPEEADTTLNQAYLQAVQALRQGASCRTEHGQQQWPKIAQQKSAALQHQPEGPSAFQQQQGHHKDLPAMIASCKSTPSADPQHQDEVKLAQKPIAQGTEAGPSVPIHDTALARGAISSATLSDMYQRDPLQITAFGTYDQQRRPAASGAPAAPSTTEPGKSTEANGSPGTFEACAEAGHSTSMLSASEAQAAPALATVAGSSILSMLIQQMAQAVAQATDEVLIKRQQPLETFRLDAAKTVILTVTSDKPQDQLQRDLLDQAEGKPLPPPRLGPPPPGRLEPPTPAADAIPPPPPVWSSPPRMLIYGSTAWTPPPPGSPPHRPSPPQPPPGGPLPPPPLPPPPSASTSPALHSVPTRPQLGETAHAQMIDPQADALPMGCSASITQSKRALKRVNSLGSMGSNIGSDDDQGHVSQSTEHHAGAELQIQGNEWGVRKGPKKFGKRMRQKQNRAAKLADSAQAAFLLAAGRPLPEPLRKPPKKRAKRHRPGRRWS